MHHLGYLLVTLLGLACVMGPVHGFVMKDCSEKDSDATLGSIHISTCPDTSVPRCSFVKGKNATMKASFVTKKSFTQADIAIYAIIGMLEQKFIFRGPTDACGNYGFKCPTIIGQQYELEFTLPVPTYSPSVPAEVKFTLTDENKSNIFCFEFPVRVTS